MIGAGHDQDGAVFAIEYTERRNPKMMGAATARQKRTATQTSRMHCHVVVAEIAVKQRCFDELAFSSSLAMEQRGQNRSKSMDASTDVADADLRQHRQAVRLTNHAQHAGIGATDKIIPRAGGERSILAEGGNRAHDDPG